MVRVNDRPFADLTALSKEVDWREVSPESVRFYLRSCDPGAEMDFSRAECRVSCDRAKAI